MIATDEDALICDLAETYHVLNYRELPLRTLACLAGGLRDDSRIRMKLAGQPIRMDSMLLAVMADQLQMLWWAKTTDGQKNVNRPKSLLNILTGNECPPEGFDTGEELMQARERIMRGGE